MRNVSISEQVSLMDRLNSFINKYGVKLYWIAEKNNIPKAHLGNFLNAKSILDDWEYQELVQFVDEYEFRMKNFKKIDN